MAPSSFAPVASLAFASLGWASNIVVGRYLAKAVDADLLNLLRWSGTAILLLPFVACRLWTDRAQVVKALPLLVLSGVVGMGLFQTCLYAAARFTSAAHVAMALALSPIVTLLASRKVQNGTEAKSHWLGFAITLSGVLLAQSRNFTGSSMMTIDHVIGDMLALIAAVLWGFYSVAAAKVPRTVPPFSALFVMATAAALISAIPVSIRGSADLRGLSFADWSAITFLVLIVSILGLAAYSFGIRSMGARNASVFIHLTPIFAIFLAWFFLHEPIGWLDGVGMILVLCGVSVAVKPVTGWNRSAFSRRSPVR